MEYSSPFVLPLPLSQPPTLSGHSSPHLAPAGAFHALPTPPPSTFERMRYVQSLASHDVSLGLRYVPPTAPLPPPASPALSALSLSTSASGYHSPAMSASPFVTSSVPPTQYSLYSAYPGVGVVSHAQTAAARAAGGEDRREGREEERKRKEAEAKQQAEEKRRAEEDRRRRQEASRQRRVEQLRRAREKREAEAAERAKEERIEEDDAKYPTVAEVMPPKPQPSLPKRRSVISSASIDAAAAGGGSRPVHREWLDVSEAEIAQQKRLEDERLKEERRLKHMQEKIALLKARMGLKDHHSSSSSPFAVPLSASRVRIPLTFSASPYAPLLVSHRPPASPARVRQSPQRFASPRRRPHPFLRHSPVRRRRLSLSPKKQRRQADEQQQQQPHMDHEDRMSGGHLSERQHQHDNFRQPSSPNKAKPAASLNRNTKHKPAPSNGPPHSSEGSDLVSSSTLSTSLQSLVESDISKHITNLTLPHHPPPHTPPSPPLIPVQPPSANPPALLRHYPSLSVAQHMDELVADVLDRLVEDTVVELNMVEERQRAGVVLGEVEDMVSELERLEESVTQRWLGGDGARTGRAHQSQLQEPRYVHDDIVADEAAYRVSKRPDRPTTSSNSSSAAASSLSSASAPSSTSSHAHPRSAIFHPRVLPVCSDVLPQLVDPTGVSLAERWCDELVDDAVSAVADELWQCLDTLVDGMLEHETR